VMEVSGAVFRARNKSVLRDVLLAADKLMVLFWSRLLLLSLPFAEDLSILRGKAFIVLAVDCDMRDHHLKLSAVDTGSRNRPRVLGLGGPGVQPLEFLCAPVIGAAVMC
jgi:hypothetical protein